MAIMNFRFLTACNNRFSVHVLDCTLTHELPAGSFTPLRLLLFPQQPPLGLGAMLWIVSRYHRYFCPSLLAALSLHTAVGTLRAAPAVCLHAI